MHPFWCLAYADVNVFESEVRSTDFSVWRAASQMVALFGRVVEALEGRASLEEVGHCGVGLKALWTVNWLHSCLFFAAWVSLQCVLPPHAYVTKPSSPQHVLSQNKLLLP